MQAIILEQNTLLGFADILALIGQSDGIAPGEVGPAAAHQRERLVKELPPARDHCRPSHLVIAAGPRRRSIERVGAVKRVVKAPPARVCRVEQEARIEDRHHQLRAGHGRNLGIDVLRADPEIARLGNEIANLRQERLVSLCIMGLSSALHMPCIDRRLQRLALGEQSAVARGKLSQQRSATLPEGLHIAAQRPEHFGFQETRQPGIDRKAGAGCHFSHLGPLEGWL